MLLVGDDLQLVRRIAGAWCSRPSGIEAIAGCRTRGLVEDLQTVIAVIDLEGNMARLVGGDGEFAGADGWLVAGDDLVVPIAVLVEPLIVPVFRNQAVRSGRRPAVSCATGGIDGNHLEAGIGASPSTAPSLNKRLRCRC